MRPPISPENFGKCALPPWGREGQDRFFSVCRSPGSKLLGAVGPEVDSELGGCRGFLGAEAVDSGQEEV